MLGDNMSAVLIFSALCLLLFSFITYRVHKQMEVEDEEIHRLAAVEQKNSASPLD
jgi:hypothetical protein